MRMTMRMMEVIGRCGVERVIQVGLMNGSASFYCSRGREVADDAGHDNDDDDHDDNDDDHEKDSTDDNDQNASNG